MTRTNISVQSNGRKRLIRGHTFAHEESPYSKGKQSEKTRRDRGCYSQRRWSQYCRRKERRISAVYPMNQTSSNAITSVKVLLDSQRLVSNAKETCLR
ncbi:hypothetical protein T265_09388 [Opisthorchis viverrini]|uniref:Uncharacterized protein n=1 Tax=Opisthorchis viverrini TaxID=6198 RepID=A0A075A562_OPIVI|nr:hypothetical protein T265_09388 [Opisthorchis viverrini]KER22559.1 hypothetical protein T265_09388 [Opisthorchis viverrini]